MYYSASELQARSGQNLRKLSEIQPLILVVWGTTFCLIYPAVTDLRAINAHLHEKMESLTAVSTLHTSLAVSLTVLVSVYGK